MMDAVRVKACQVVSEWVGTEEDANMEVQGMGREKVEVKVKVEEGELCSRKPFLISSTIYTID